MKKFFILCIGVLYSVACMANEIPIKLFTDRNGYFTEGVFKSNSPYDLDDGVSSSSNSNNYSYEVGIIANISH